MARERTPGERYDRVEADRLVHEAMGYARAQARDYARNRPGTYDDFEAAAYLGLVQASRVFDPSFGVPFVSFAHKRIAFALRDEYRRLCHQGWMGPLAEAPSFVREEGSGADAVDRVADDRLDDARLIEMGDDLLVRISKLPSRLASVFRLAYCEGRTFRQVAKTLGTSAATVTRLNRRLMESLCGYRLSGEISNALRSRLEPAVAA